MNTEFSICEAEAAEAAGLDRKALKAARDELTKGEEWELVAGRICWTKAGFLLAMDHLGFAEDVAESVIRCMVAAEAEKAAAPTLTLRIVRFYRNKRILGAVDAVNGGPVVRLRRQNRRPFDRAVIGSRVEARQVEGDLFETIGTR